MNMRASDWLWTVLITLLVALGCTITQAASNEWTPLF